MKSKKIIRIIITICLSISLLFPSAVAATDLPNFITSGQETPLVLSDCSQDYVNNLKSNIANYNAKKKSYTDSLKQLQTKDKKVKKSIKKLKKKAKKKKYKKKLKKLRARHKTYLKKISSLKKKKNNITLKINDAKAKLDAVKIEEPFTRISGTVGGYYINNLINYAVIPKGSVSNVDVESAEPNFAGEQGELRGRKTVEKYVSDAADISDEVIAINGQGWGGPWATEKCTYDAENRTWTVPEDETIGGWKYNIPNPNYEEDLKTNENAKKTIGTLSYTKKYAGFRIQISGMMKNGDTIITGNINQAHEEWIAFRPDGSFCYGSNKDGEMPPSDYLAAVSGAKIIDDGKFIENGWASGGPKTIIGTRPNGDVVLVSTVGRMSEFYSFTPYEHCCIMQSLGCDNALCLDGGGSTSMVYKFKDSSKTVNIATCGKAKTNRPVANALLFYLKN